VTGAGRIKAVRRFVEHQQPRPSQQRGRKPETLSHPEREAANAVVRDIGEPDLLQRVADAVGAVAPQARQRGEVLPSSERGIQTRPIHEPRDPVRKSERPAHRTAENLQVAAVGLGQPEEQAQQRRLPGPVRTDQAVHLALCDVEVDPLEGDHLAEELADPARPNCECPVHLRPRCCVQHEGSYGPSVAPTGPPVERRVNDRLPCVCVELTPFVRRQLPPGADQLFQVARRV
jgi:hypothetical protein